MLMFKNSTTLTKSDQWESIVVYYLAKQVSNMFSNKIKVNVAFMFR